MNPDKLAEETKAIFVKLNKETRMPERCWDGEVSKITKRTDRVWVQFRLAGRTKFPEKYGGSPDGWYVDDLA